MGAMEEPLKEAHSIGDNESDRIFSEQIHGNVVVEDVINSIRRLESDDNSIVIFISGVTCTNDSELPTGSAVGVFFSPSSPLNLSERVPGRFPLLVTAAEMYAAMRALEEFCLMSDNTNLWHPAIPTSTQVTNEYAETANKLSDLEEEERDDRLAREPTPLTDNISDNSSDSTMVVTDSEESEGFDYTSHMREYFGFNDMIVRENTIPAPKRFGISRVVIVTECEELIDNLCEENAKEVPRGLEPLPHKWELLREGRSISASVSKLEVQRDSLLKRHEGFSAPEAADTLKQIQSLDSEIACAERSYAYTVFKAEEDRVKEIAYVEGLSVEECRNLLELKWELYRAAEAVERLCPLDLWLVEKGTILEARNLALRSPGINRP
ncbi:hypothetical protein HYFRA_00000855 [Hymenoscyphus fraxineus]|uniref:Uncharacterized protein n=1 Tax=Hymenoscyphus fraxineus TaxID=746836 RepID=A0A9N9PS34_9HELO|nr:hypothetical protein HYFRA_00000855 [Hymenoscyphus fraxineus]